MKMKFCILLWAISFAATFARAQDSAAPPRRPAAGRADLPVSRLADSAAGANYSTDIVTVHDAQSNALAQARQMLAGGEGVRDRAALESAIKEMERAESALAAARNSPDKLSAALAAEQSAYQALLKVAPREFRMRQSRSGQRQQGASAGQPSPQEMNELDTQREENRYETESQAAAPQTPQQREQSQTSDRLRQLAQRQQDLNDRLRDLQTALQAARTDEQRADLQRQLKRLQEEQRQMLANVDEMRQQLAQSPNAGSQTDTQRQLEQTRSDMERAAQQMDRQAPSDALAAGTRAQERMQNLRNDLRQQTSSQFSEQVRQLRNQARDLTRREDEIARGLDSLNNGERQALDNAAERQQVVQQMAQQQSGLTNLLSQMREISEQTETAEPLLSQQLYDTLRRADQTRLQNLMEVGSQLTDRGFLPQASQAERMTRTNLTQLVAGVERAADSVLGSEADALRFAQRELDQLTRQVERELGTNATAGTMADGTNSASRGIGRAISENTNPLAAANASGRDNNASNQPQRENAGNAAQNENRNGPPGRNNQPAGQNNERTGRNGEQASAENQQPGQPQAGSGENGGEYNPDSGNAGRRGNQPRDGQAQTQARNGGDRLRQLAVQLGGDPNAGGPITGGGYLYWSYRLRDVEQAVEPADLRNQLATVRERVSALRAEYRQSQRKPDLNVVRAQIVTPLTQVRVWLQDELARREKSDRLVPLDRDPVPDNYAELVRAYYQKLGNGQ